MRMASVAVVLSIALASSTGAQTLSDPLAAGISGTLGAGRTWDDEGQIGNGLLAVCTSTAGGWAAVWAFDVAGG
jgi:hypothetical protein